jgi:hypothetical protein
MPEEGIVKEVFKNIPTAGLWFPSSRVQTRPKPLDFSDVKILSIFLRRGS